MSHNAPDPGAQGFYQIDSTEEDRLLQELGKATLSGMKPAGYDSLYTH